MMLRSRTRTTGQSMVEFALAVPLLALLLSGIAAFGFLLYAHVQVSNATREAARAGSLYLGARFRYTSCTAGASCPTGYGSPSNPDCWNLNQWVENALAEVERENTGCPRTTGSVTYSVTNHSFGRLPFGSTTTSKCPSAASGTDCWWLESLTLNGVPVDSTTAGSPPRPRNSAAYIIANDRVTTPLQVQVLYRYNVPFFGQVFNANPLLIRKTVIMRLQNN